MEFEEIMNVSETQKDFGDFAGTARRTRLTESELRARLEYYAASDGGFETTDEHFDTMKQIFRDHSNVFITGGAGTGKTTFVRSILIPELNHRGIRWAVTATTGIAGSHLEGKTLHSFFGIALGPQWTRVYPRGMVDYYNKAYPGEPCPMPQDMSREELQCWYAYHYDSWATNRNIPHYVRQGVLQRLRGHDVVIVDEISMCGGAAMLGYLDYMLRKVRGKDTPFGGLQMIFVGDFAQLPPVDEHNDASRADWAFLSHAWEEGHVKACELTRVFRQGDDRFIRFLNNVRRGYLSDDDKDYAQQFVRNGLKGNALAWEETREYTFLFPTNQEASNLNREALGHYPAPTIPIDAEFHIIPGVQKNLTSSDEKNLGYARKSLIKALRILPETLELRIGYPVMFTINDRDGRFVNGTRGFVRNIHVTSRSDGFNEDTDFIEVTIPSKNGVDEHIKVYRNAYSRDREQDPYKMTTLPVGYNETHENKYPATVSLYPTVRQFPLIPATAITVHKCVDKSTLIPSSEGITSIEDICNSSVMPDVAGKVGFKPACEPFIGVQELGYKITTRRGYEVVVSERHPMLRVSSDGEAWVKAPELRVNDGLRMRGATHAYGPGILPAYDMEQANYNNTECDHKLPVTLTDDLAWLLGILIGDGCVSDKRAACIAVTSMDWEVLNRFADIMKTEFGLMATLKPRPTSKARVSYVHCWGVCRWLLWLGLPHATAGDKSVPAAILTGTKSQQSAFLRGYFDSAGGVNAAVYVTSSSRILIGQIHLMLLNMGIAGTLTTMKASWRINITGVDVPKYRDLVGFSAPRKMLKCEELAPSHRKVPKVQCGSYPRTLGVSIATALRKELAPIYPAAKGLGFGDFRHWAWYLSRVKLGKVSLTDAHLAAMQRDLPLCVNAGEVSAKVFEEASDGCFIDRIASIERVTGDMRDICVPDGHAFVGNGFVNHNSQGMSMDKAVLTLTGSFAAGQAYVALSRLTSPEGLVMLDHEFTPKVDPIVSNYYQSIVERRRQLTNESKNQSE